MITHGALGDLVIDILDADEAHLTRETVLQELPSWDSVNALRLLIHIESLLTVTLPPELFEEPLTLQALHEVIVTSGQW